MRSSLIMGIAAAVVAILLTIYFIPPIDDFSPDNPGWNGLSKLSSELRLHPISDIIQENLLSNPSNTTLLIIGPEKNFTESEAFVIKRFLESGGLVILADDFGSGNSLLELLGLSPRFNGSLLVDPLFKDRNMRLPKIRMLAPEMEEAGIDELLLNYATVIDGCSKPLALSSSYSFLDVNLNGVWDVGEPRGPLTVACMLDVGDGRLLLISDSSMAINSMLRLSDNMLFLKMLAEDRKIVLDGSHWVPSNLALAKSLLRSLVGFLSAPEVRYSILAAVVLTVMRYRWPRKAAESEVERVLIRNPTWDREVLVRLEREMRGER